MKVKNMTAGTLVRTVTLVVALLNLVLTSFGKNPLPFSDEQIYTGLLYRSVRFSNGGSRLGSLVEE